ncbi:MAG: TIGR04013 family B12-binding domain/radical SAM domain-containing protein [Methanomicrobiales archaeon]|nr:TIGR04013 family B12-binding domain/radical SAM domain-containing protein [Methanomicrobiales archaeon]
MRVCWRRINAANNSLAALHAACKLQGYDLEVTEGPQRDVTCYSLNSVNEPSYRKEIERADCITIVGGPHASACWREVAAYADYVVVGEGERVLPALLSSIEAGSEELPRGVATSRGFVPAEFCTRLDAYPPFTRMKGFIEISRGCPHLCAFCQTPRLFGPSMRHRSIERIAEYAKRYRDVRFVSPNALAYGSDGRSARLEKVEVLLKALKGNIYFGTFPSEVRPEFVTDKALELISAHCMNEKLHFGAQSGSDRVLGAMQRGHSTREVIDAVECCHEHGFTPVVDFIVGLPMETEQDQLDTLRLIRWVVRFGKVHIHLFHPIPGTPLAGHIPIRLHAELPRTFGRLALQGRLTGSWLAPSVKVF